MSQSGTPLIGGDVEEESQMGSTQEVRKKGGRKRSIVWKHFTQVDNKTKTKCNYCDIEFANGPTTGTTHLHRHLESACTKIPKEEKEAFVKSKSSKLDQQPAWKYMLDNYLAEDVIDAEYANFDILQWWKKNSELYPTLARMARDFLAVPVSTVASESAFNAAGQLLDHLRNSMVEETAEALICTKDWFGPDDGNFDLEQFHPFMTNS